GRDEPTSDLVAQVHHYSRAVIEAELRRLARRRPIVAAGLNRAVLLLDVLTHDTQRCAAHGACEVRARPEPGGDGRVGLRRAVHAIGNYRQPISLASTRTRLTCPSPVNGKVFGASWPAWSPAWARAELVQRGDNRPRRSITHIAGSGAPPGRLCGHR